MQGIPLYVTRKTADGLIGEWSISPYVGLLIWFIFLINVLLWGGVGIYEALKFIT